MKNILFITTSYVKNKDRLHKALVGAKRKYGNELRVYVPYTAPNYGVARMAANMGIEVIIVAPDLEVVTRTHLDFSTGITILSTTHVDYYRYLVETVSGVVSTDPTEVITAYARKSGVPVYIPE